MDDPWGVQQTAEMIAERYRHLGFGAKATPAEIDAQEQERKLERHRRAARERDRMMAAGTWTEEFEAEHQAEARELGF